MARWGAPARVELRKETMGAAQHFTLDSLQIEEGACLTMDGGFTAIRPRTKLTQRSVLEL